jgi:hypothetical protein
MKSHSYCNAYDFSSFLQFSSHVGLKRLKRLIRLIRLKRLKRLKRLIRLKRLKRLKKPIRLKKLKWLIRFKILKRLKRPKKTMKAYEIKKFPSERIQTYCEGVGTSLCTKSKHSRRGFSLANNET